jgi:hypothetical protein
MIRPTMSHVLNKQDLYSLMGDYATYLERKIAELEKQPSMRGTLADPNYNYDKKEYRKGEVEDE